MAIRKYRFNENRSFGVEIECFCKVSRRELGEIMESAGIKARVSIGYTHNTDSSNDTDWWIKTDGSLYTNGLPEGYTPMEIVSPVLKGTDGLEQIRKVCAILAREGIEAKVNSTCGLHVHHVVRDYTNRDFKVLIHNYAVGQKAINDVLPESRRYSNYARTMERWASDEVLKLSASEFRDTFASDRYMAVNYNSYAIRGTIEFRQHNGTVNAEEIVNWVILTQAIIEKSKTGCIGEAVTIDNLCWRLGVFRRSSKELVEFYMNRAIAFTVGV